MAVMDLKSVAVFLEKALPIVTSSTLREIPDLFISLERLIAESTETEEVAESRVAVAADEKEVETFF